jgi:hypothetical protein
MAEVVETQEGDFDPDVARAIVRSEEGEDLPLSQFLAVAPALGMSIGLVELA